MLHIPVHLVHLTLAVAVAANVDAGAVTTEKPSPIRLQLVPRRPPDPNDPPKDYELHRVKGGSGDLIYEASGFTARIVRDGSVIFRDRHLSLSFALLPHPTHQPTITGVPTLESVLRGNGTKHDPTPVSAEEQTALYGSRLPIPTVTPYRPDPREACQYPAPCFFNAPVLLLSVKGSFDLTDELMRLGGQDPYRYAKARFLAGTREMRTRMAARAHGDDVRRSAAALPDHLEAIACDGRLSVGERRAIIEALRAELDTSMAEGRAAGAEIGRFLALFAQADGGVTCSGR